MSEELSRQERWTLPDSWCWSTMGQIADVVGGGTPRTSELANWNGQIPWITPADLSGYTAKTITSGARTISERGLADSGARMLPAGTVLMSSRAPVGYVAIATNPLSTNQGFKSFVLRGSLLPDYVYWYLKRSRDLLHEFASGTTFPEVSGRRAAEIPIPVAPLAEQRRIVAALEEHLSDLDAAVAGLKRAKANLERYRAATLDAAITGALVGNTGALGSAPEGWCVAMLAEVSDIQGGIQKQPKRTPVSNHYPFLRVANVHRSRLVLDEVHRIELFGAELERLRLQRGDLLIVEGNGSPGEIGRMAVWDGSIPDCVHQNHLIRARPRPGIVSDFLSIYWNSPQGMRRVQAAASSTSGLHTLSVAKVGRIPVPVPPTDTQHRIVSEVQQRLAVAGRTTSEIDVQLARAARMRQSLLKRAFEGKLVPQDPSDEPATTLLARLRDTPNPATASAPRPRSGRARPTSRRGRS